MDATHVMLVALVALLVAIAIEYGNVKRRETLDGVRRPVSYGTVFIIFALCFGFGMAALVFFDGQDTAKPDLLRNVKQGDPAF